MMASRWSRAMSARIACQRRSRSASEKRRYGCILTSTMLAQQGRELLREPLQLRMLADEPRVYFQRRNAFIVDVTQLARRLRPGQAEVVHVLRLVERALAHLAHQHVDVQLGEAGMSGRAGDAQV